MKPKKLKTVSLFDGISCGQLAIERAGYETESYVAFETDKYARSITRYNYPSTEHKGDVMDTDFKAYKGYDLVIGGSPCIYWSIGKTGREVDKTGMGWKLFMRFVEAIRTINPPYFIYENVASMPPSIKDYISQELGCLPLKINSALVSAQQRKRLYWTNIGETEITEGLTSNIPQPADKGILLKDIIDCRADDTDKTHQLSITTEPILLSDKSPCICARDYKNNVNILLKRKQYGSMVIHKAPDRIGEIGKGGQGCRIYSVNGKSVSMGANGGGWGAKTGLYKIDLPDGNYIIRKLSPKEAERCQTIPDDYTATGTDDNGKTIPISNTQRYKTIGNGWTIDVIVHILKHIARKEASIQSLITEEIPQNAA